MDGMDCLDGMDGMDDRDGMDGADGTHDADGMGGMDGMDGMDGMFSYPHTIIAVRSGAHASFVQQIPRWSLHSSIFSFVTRLTLQA